MSLYNINNIDYNKDNKTLELYNDDKLICVLLMNDWVEKVLIKAILNYENKKYLRFVDENEIIR